MKRSAGALLLLAGLSGCMSDGSKAPQLNHFNQATHAKQASALQGPWGQPVAMGQSGRAVMPYSSSSGVVQAGGIDNLKGSGIQQAAGFRKGGIGCTDCGVGGGAGSGIPAAPPAPYMGPPGAVAAIGNLPAARPMMPINQRTEVRFVAPAGMQVSWLGMGGFGEHVIDVPGRYNFVQGGIYRLKLSGMPTRPTMILYPTIEVMPSTHRSAAYLAHAAVPVAFTEQDLEQIDEGNYLVKVIYLPDPQYQDLAAIAGPNEIVSSRLAPGIDPVVEAQRRGEILLIIRVGNIDLQAPNTPAMTAPNPYPGGPGMPGNVVPGSVVPGTAVPPKALPKAPETPEATGENVTKKPERRPLLSWLTGSKEETSKVKPASMKMPARPVRRMPGVANIN